MKRNQVLLIILAVALMMFIVPAAAAQSTADLEFSDIIDQLGPRSGTALLWDILLYMIFFIGLVNMALIPDKQMFPSMINLAVMGMAVVSKLLVGTANVSNVLNPTDLPVLVLNVGMFVLPLSIAGMVRSHRGKAPKAIMPSILMGLIGGTYFFLFWAVEMRAGASMPSPNFIVPLFMLW